MKDFEETCEKLKIPLFVLPPEKLTYNWKIERSNGIFRKEFYDDLTGGTIVGSRINAYTLVSINPETHFRLNLHILIKIFEK